MTHWYKVSTRLPRIGVDVLCWVKDDEDPACPKKGFAAVGYYREGWKEGITGAPLEVTHWATYTTPKP